jgi:hypothetical protein
MGVTEGGASPRPLDRREREILDFLLTVDTPGISELRQQTDHVLAVPWKCGCASIDLIVDRGAAPASAVTVRPTVETTTNERNDPDRIFDLLLWVDDGYLSGVEIVDYTETHGEASGVFPPVSDFATPQVRQRT